MLPESSRTGRERKYFCQRQIKIKTEQRGEEGRHRSLASVIPLERSWKTGNRQCQPRPLSRREKSRISQINDIPRIYWKKIKQSQSIRVCSVKSRLPTWSDFIPITARQSQKNATCSKKNTRTKRGTPPTRVQFPSRTLSEGREEK